MSANTSLPDSDSGGKKKLPADCFHSISMPKNWDQVEKLKSLKEKLTQKIASALKCEKDNLNDQTSASDDEKHQFKNSDQERMHAAESDTVLINRPESFIQKQYSSSHSSADSDINNEVSKNSDSLKPISMDQLDQTLLNADSINNTNTLQDGYRKFLEVDSPWKECQKMKYLVPKNIVIQPVHLNPKVVVEPLKLHGRIVSGISPYEGIKVADKQQKNIYDKSGIVSDGTLIEQSINVERDQEVGVHNQTSSKSTNKDEKIGDKKESDDRSRKLFSSILSEHMNKVCDGTASSKMLANISADKIQNTILQSNLLDKKLEIAKLKMLCYSKRMMVNKHKSVLNKWAIEMIDNQLEKNRLSESKTDFQSKTDMLKSYVIKSPKANRKVPGSVRKGSSGKKTVNLSSNQANIPDTSVESGGICKVVPEKINNLAFETKKNLSVELENLTHENKALTSFPGTMPRSQTIGRNLSKDKRVSRGESKSIFQTENRKTIHAAAAVTIQNKIVAESEQSQQIQKSEIKSDVYQMEETGKQLSCTRNNVEVQPSTATGISNHDSAAVDTDGRLKIKINPPKSHAVISKVQDSLSVSTKTPNKTLFQKTCSAIAAKNKLAATANNVNATKNTAPKVMRNDALKNDTLNTYIKTSNESPASGEPVTHSISNEPQGRKTSVTNIPSTTFVTSSSVLNSGTTGSLMNNASHIYNNVTSSTTFQLSSSSFTLPTFSSGLPITAFPVRPKVYSATVSPYLQNISAMGNTCVTVTKPVITPGIFPWLHVPIENVQAPGAFVYLNPYGLDYRNTSSCENTYLSATSAFNMSVGATSVKNNPEVPAPYTVRALHVLQKPSSSQKIITPIFKTVSETSNSVSKLSDILVSSNSAAKRPAEPLDLASKRTRIEVSPVPVVTQHTVVDGYTEKATGMQNGKSKTENEKLVEDENNQNRKSYVSLKRAVSLFGSQEKLVPVSQDRTSNIVHPLGEKMVTGLETPESTVNDICCKTQLNVADRVFGVQDVKQQDKKYRFHSGKPQNETIFESKQNDIVRQSAETLSIQSLADRSRVMHLQSDGEIGKTLSLDTHGFTGLDSSCHQLQNSVPEKKGNAVLNFSEIDVPIMTQVSNLDTTKTDKSLDIKPIDDESNLDLFEQFKIKPSVPVFNMSSCNSFDQSIESFKQDTLSKMENHSSEPIETFNEVSNSMPRIANCFSLAGNSLDLPGTFCSHNNQSSICTQAPVLASENLALNQTNQLVSEDVCRVVNVTLESDTLPEQLSLINIPKTTGNGENHQILSEQNLIKYLCSTNNEKTKLILLNGNVCDKWEKLKTDLEAETLSDPEFLHLLLTTVEKKIVNAAKKKDTGSQTNDKSDEFSPEPHETEHVQIDSNQQSNMDRMLDESMPGGLDIIHVEDDDYKEHEDNPVELEIDLNNKTLLDQNNNTEIVPNYNLEADQSCDRILDCSNGTKMDQSSCFEVSKTGKLEVNPIRSTRKDQLFNDQVKIGLEKISKLAETSTAKKTALVKAGKKRSASVSLESQFGGMITAKKVSGREPCQAASASNQFAKDSDILQKSVEAGQLEPTLAELLRSTVNQKVKVQTSGSDTMPQTEQESPPITSSNDPPDVLLEKFYSEFNYSVSQWKDMNWHISNFRDFLQANGYSEDFEHKSPEWLNNMLLKFYIDCATTHKHFICYLILCTSRSYLCSYLAWLSDSRINILEDKVFKHSNDVYDIVRKIDSGFVPQHKSTAVFTPADDVKLKNSGVLSDKTPVNLLWKVFFDINYYLGDDGFPKDFLHGLKKDSLIFSSDKQGNYCTFQDNCWPKPSSFKSKMYEKSEDYHVCPVRTLKFYLSKLSQCDALFQCPKYVYTYTGVWYYSAPLSKPKLCSLMKEISKSAGLSCNYSVNSIVLLAKKHRFLKEMKSVGKISLVEHDKPIVV